MNLPASLLASPHRQRGISAILLLLFIGGTLALIAFSSDSARISADAAQLKRATDAAAMAAALARAADPDAEIQRLSERYVGANLGLDEEQTSRQLAVIAEPVTREGDRGVRVSARFSARPLLSSSDDVQATVRSTAIAREKSLEVALALPNTSAETAANLAVLRRVTKNFASQLIAQQSDQTWLALVPYSQAVNVSPTYTNPSTRSPRGPSAEHIQRLRQWAAAGALNPVELTTLFRSGKASSMADARIPDRRANLLCLYRGLQSGENYFWDEAPGGQFKVYYRADLPENGSPGADPISWVGPNPLFGRATGTNDTRWMVADKGCPSAPLLPLTNDLDQIDERLEHLSARYNANYAIALGWSAMALSPAFRGSAGWNLPDDLPRNFRDDKNGSYKAVVMLVNTTGQRWMDTDGYNFETGQNSGSLGSEILRDQAASRFVALCNSFSQRKLRVFVIVVGVDGIANNDLGAEGTLINGVSAFRTIAGPGLARCAEEASDITYLSGADFTATEASLRERLDEILEDIRQKRSFVQLVD